MPDTANFTTSLYLFLSATVLLTFVAGIPCSCPMLTVYFPASEFDFIYKVGTVLFLLSSSFNFTNMGTDFVAKITEVRHKINKEVV